MNRERVDTPRSCPLCGDASVREGCRLCGGQGFVDAATAARWASGHRAKVTSTGIVLGDLVATILDGIRKTEDVGPEQRRAAYAPVAAWQRTALEHLTATAARPQRDSR